MTARHHSIHRAIWLNQIGPFDSIGGETAILEETNKRVEFRKYPGPRIEARASPILQKTSQGQQ